MNNNKSWLTGVVASGVASTAILGGVLVGGGDISSSQAAEKTTAKVVNITKNKTSNDSHSIVNTQNASVNKNIKNTIDKNKATHENNKVSRSQERKNIKQVKSYLVVRGQGSTYMVNEGTKVKELLKSAKITMGKDDKLSVDENSTIKNNSVIIINNITKKTYDKNVSIPYKTLNKIETSNCNAGSVATTSGTNGTAIEHWAKTFTNGNLTGDDKISSIIKSKPIDSINTICSVTPNESSTTDNSVEEQDSSTDSSATIEKPNVTVSGSNVDWMKAAGISESDYQYVNYIVYHESGWDYNAVNASSGAFGLCQALPAGKLASAGADWKTNPVTQLKWCNNYASERYGSWANAYKAWTIQHWW